MRIGTVCDVDIKVNELLVLLILVVVVCGKILRVLLSRGLGFRKATNLIANCGILLGMMFVAIGIYTFDSGLINPTLLITPVFLVYSAIMEKKTAAYIFLRSISYKRDALLKYGTISEGICKVKAR